jgi:F-type H+-transporting ATPase subunit gamma
MPSIKDLKKRIATTKNTQQTTKAMKMVSAAKLRRAQEAITSQRPYAKALGELIKTVASLGNEEPASPLFGRVRADETGATAKPRLVLLLVTSDRGLAGAFNSNVIKTAHRWIAANKQNYASIELNFLGKKGFDFFKTKAYTIGTNHADLSGRVTIIKAKKLADKFVERYLGEEIDEVKIVYNEFKNAVTQTTMVDTFLPITPEKAATESPAPAKAEATENAPIYILKPSQRELMEALLKKQFATQTYRIMLDSQAGEHGARMSAMENATKNAGEMIRKLTLQYNKQRQAGITKELLEIIAGSESQKGA